MSYVNEVVALEVPRFEEGRKFPGLDKQKIEKQDRHMSAVTEFGKTLDTISEKLEKDVLLLSRSVREELQTIDDSLAVVYKTLEDDEYLTAQNEPDVLNMLTDIKKIVSNRYDTISTFSQSLDNIEMKRADVVGTELKSLVDQLIIIAHQLPDEIQHIVETESFELNSVLTKNRKAYAELISMMKERGIEVEVESLQRWENGYQRWRHLRHDKAISDFLAEVNSSKYTDPENRQQFMARTKEGQMQRQAARLSYLAQLAEVNAENIVTDEIVRIQAGFASVSESEMAAVQECYNGLTDLRVQFNARGHDRVENFRKELHEYGALKIEPKLGKVAEVFSTALRDPDMTNTWRVGGGLKPDINYLMNEMQSTNVVYDKSVANMQSKLEIIVCSFGLKEIMEERGRAAQLDKVRNLLVKMRNVSREEIPDVLDYLMPELEEILEVERLSAVFRKEVSECLEEMKAELAKVGMAGLTNSTSTATTTMRTVPNRSVSINPSAMDTKTSAYFVNPTSVKIWSTRLCVLYFASDLLPEYQQAAREALDGIHIQRECNVLVDQVVSQVCDKPLNNLDKQYKKLIDSIANHLEGQVNHLTVVFLNIGNFFLSLAKHVEAHRKVQHKLDEQSMDELFDKKEDDRFEREDREADFDQACQSLRKSTNNAEVADNFKEILNVLDVIESNYRDYHKRASYLADKHALSLVDEYKNFLLLICKKFSLVPLAPHVTLTTFNRLHENILMFNRNLFEEDPCVMKTLPITTEPGSEPYFESHSDGHIPEEYPFRKEYVSPNEVNYLQYVEDQKELEAIASDPNTHSHSRAGSRPSRSLRSQSLPCSRQTSRANSPRDSQCAEGGVPLRGGKYGLLRSLQDICTSMTLESTITLMEEQVSEAEGHLAAALAPPPSTNTSTKQLAIPSYCSQDFGEAEPTDISNPGTPEKEKEETLLSEVNSVVVEETEDMTEEVHEVHELQPWFKTTVTIESVDKLAEWLEEDEDLVYAYDKACLGGFKPVDHEVVVGWPEELQEEYKLVLEKMEKTKKRVAAEADYTQNVPMDKINNRPWTCIVDISVDQLASLLGNMRDSLVVSMEKEVQARIKQAEDICANNKAELNEELEDRLLKHSPRRGRVETQLKQPRETELLSHEEKTWRHVKNIQEQMIAIQKLFKDECYLAKSNCDRYVADSTAIRELLFASTFKTLAALQGIDVRARSTTISFQAAWNSQVIIFNRLCDQDPLAVITFAQDFRKVCPPQEAGKEGGYSETEIDEIQLLVDGQCAEVRSMMETWKEEVIEWQDYQKKSLLCQDEFNVAYEKSVQNVAMSEGLGQKYGAPRRRAQEALRTEVTRDDQSAGYVDELLATMEFTCSEKQMMLDTSRLSGGATTDEHDVYPPEEEEDEDNEVVGPNTAPKNAKPPKQYCPLNKLLADNSISGREELDEAQEMWHKLCHIRQLLQQRALYLEVLPPDSEPITVFDLPWLTTTRIPQAATLHSTPGSETPIEPQQPDDNMALAEAAPLSPRYLRPEATNLRSVVEEVDRLCRLETRTLYENEGVMDKLVRLGDEDEDSIVPESLSTWLSETREKLLGSDGHREKAWKRYWVQLDRLELLFRRKKPIAIPSKIPQPIVIVMGAPGYCIRNITEAYIRFSNMTQHDNVKSFMKLVKVWEQARNKHERLLRPRLGSPDAVQELDALDAVELQRSEEMTCHMTKFRNDSIKMLIANALSYLMDIAVACRGLMLLVDGTLRQETIELPPDTAIPKVRMTMKRMRKMQRVQEEVEKNRLNATLKAGEKEVPKGKSKKVDPVVAAEPEDRVSVRTWGGINLDATELVNGTEESAAEAFSSVVDSAQSILNEKGGDEDLLVTAEWKSDLIAHSEVKAAVSMAHRTILVEREGAIVHYSGALSHIISNVQTTFGGLIAQEASWNERWKRQVEMLRRGNI